jgi:hypothetical protein
MSKLNREYCIKSDFEAVNWNNLVDYKYQLGAFVNKMTNFGFCKREGIVHWASLSDIL